MKLLREWKTSSFTAGENGHRHQSHLMAMYPYRQISPESEYFEPAVNSLAMRGDVSTGWSLGWRINLWARALNGEHAHKLIVNALRHAGSYGQSNGAGGIYYNLFDSHAPFQIDGNFGYTAGVTEMMMQSYIGVIRLLPALPAEWTDGSITGIRAEGNFTVDQTWDGGVLSTARIIYGSGSECVLNYTRICDADIKAGTGAEVKVTRIDDNNISFPTEASMTYIVDYPNNSGIGSILADTDTIGIKFNGNIAATNYPDAILTVYSLSGVTLATARGNIDISVFAGTPVVIKAVHASGTAVAKTIPAIDR